MRIFASRRRISQFPEARLLRIEQSAADHVQISERRGDLEPVNARPERRRVARARGAPVAPAPRVEAHAVAKRRVAARGKITETCIAQRPFTDCGAVDAIWPAVGVAVVRGA